MKRSWISLLLAFCLVSSQQGALLHELRHLAPRLGTATTFEASMHAAGVACDICFAFEHIAGAVASPCVLHALLSTAEYWPVAERFTHLAAVPPEASARDPPMS